VTVKLGITDEDITGDRESQGVRYRTCRSTQDEVSGPVHGCGKRDQDRGVIVDDSYPGPMLGPRSILDVALPERQSLRVVQQRMARNRRRRTPGNPASVSFADVPRLSAFDDPRGAGQLRPDADPKPGRATGIAWMDGKPTAWLERARSPGLEVLDLKRGYDHRLAGV